MIKVKQRKKPRKKQSTGKDKHMIKKKKHKKDCQTSLQSSVPEGRRKKRKRFVVYDSDVDTTIKAKKKHVRMEICLENGVIKIDVEAVHRLLGIPKTGLNLKSMPARRRLCPRIQQWRNLYGKEFISTKDIASRMAVDVSDDSLDFELDFLMLFMSTMVECQAHGKCRLEMLDYLDNYTDLSVINWSAYVLDCIKRCKSGWEPFTKKPFKGALTILTLLYVERFSCEGVDVDETKTTIKFWTLDKLHEREALEISGGGFGNGKYIPLSADDCPKKNCTTLQDRPSSSDMYGLEVTRENKKKLETDLGIMIHQHPADVKVKKLMVAFEEVFKQKILVEEAEPHNGVNATISKSDAKAYHERDKDDGESPHSGKKRLEKSHEDSPDSVVNLSNSSPIMKGQVVGIRKSYIKKLKLASAEKSDSSPIDKDKHMTLQVNLTVDGGQVELQTTGVLLGNIHEPSFSLGMTQEGIGNVTPNDLVNKAGSKEVVHVHSTLSKQSVLKKKSRVRFDVSGQMKVDAPSFSLGMTQEELEKLIQIMMGRGEPKSQGVGMRSNQVLTPAKFDSHSKSTSGSSSVGNTMSCDRNIRSLSRTEWEERRKKGLCFMCGQLYGPTHRCPEGKLRILLLEEDEEVGEKGEQLLLEALSENVNSDLSNGTCLALEMAGDLDLILGMEWLQSLGEVTHDWKHAWMKFMYLNTTVTLQGSLPTQPQAAALQKWLSLDEDNHTLVGLRAIQGSAALPETNYDHLFPTQQKQLHSLLLTYTDLFHLPSGLPPQRAHDHHIPLTTDIPVAVRPYRYPHVQKNEIEKQVQELLTLGMIRASNSAYSSPVILFRKKDNSWRMCVDYRALNKVTIPDKFPIPVVEELLDELHGAYFFSKLDLKSDYNQIRMKEESIKKTAFRTHEGHYEYLVMPFGLMNAPATFQAVMNDIFRPLLCHSVVIFFDDILVYSPTWENHLIDLKKVFQLLRNNFLVLNSQKCSFGQSKVEYLGHIISGHGVSMDPSKIQAVKDWPLPTSIKGLRGFLGLTGYYRKFIQHYGSIARPLTDLTKKNAFLWSDQAQAAFDQLKQA
ncbi:hypothetical protein E3N88_30877 [Mikania micrantha]|uniref:Reverse transcriptase domain-containing protein n=1 Tax=Mikania micrantha TaxID=192012 RepID=A0A5N6MNB7_9ASTR|nr:hypothetical protein E3N88_30877 [Mikania micrantha]